GLATVLAPATGGVRRIDVLEGGQVEAGQLLAVVSRARTTLADGETSAALERRRQRRREGLQSARDAQQQPLGAQGDGLRAQLAAAERELGQIEAEIDTRRGQVRIAEETLLSLRKLEGERYVSLLQIKQQESNALSW